MPNDYISTIVLPGDSTTYYIKDSEARDALANKITDPASKSNGNFLMWNGSNWVAAVVPEGGLTGIGAGDTVIHTETVGSVATISTNIDPTQGNVTLSKETNGLKANIADNALTIAKTSGLQTALNNKENTSNKVTSISASSTDDQYTSAKCVWTVTENIREVAEGKTKSYVINLKSNITGTYDATTDSYKNVTAITGVTLANLKIGDVILIKQFDVADYWVSAITGADGICLNKLETTKIDLTQYVSKNEAGSLAYKSSATGSFTPAGTVSTPTITITPTTTTVNSMTDAGTLPSFTQGDDTFTQGSFTQGTFNQGTLPTHGEDTFTQGSFTQGSFSQGSLPSWSASVTSEVLSFDFSAGTLPTHGNDTFTKPTFSQGTFSQGTLPTHGNDSYTKPTFTQGEDTWSAGTLPTKGSDTTVVTSASATSTQPQFEGTAGTVTVS